MSMGTTSGAGLATYAYYNAFCKLFPGMVDGAIAEHSCSGICDGFIPIPDRSKIAALLSGSLHRYKAFLKKFLKKHGTDYSLCIVNGSVYAGDMMNLIHSYGIKIVVIHHNYEVEYFMTNKSSFTLWGHFPYLISKNEGNAYRKADYNLFLTKPDMEKCMDVYGQASGENHLIGVFEIMPRKFIPSKCLSDETLILTGSLCTYQTIYSIINFEEEYFNLVKNEFPNLKIIMAGRNPSEVVLKLKEKHPNSIEVIANPDNMDDVMDMGNVYFCPTCIGGGLKLRVMDGLRKGLPVLTHKISARGYEVFFDKPYFQVYDDVKSFIKGLKMIKAYIRGNGYGFQNEILKEYEMAFGFESGVNRLEGILGKKHYK